MPAIASPMNFGMVSPGIYRSGFPSRHNLSFLKQLNLRTLVALDDGKAELAVVTDVTMGGSSMLDGQLQPWTLKSF